jgi:hypothetical protein
VYKIGSLSEGGWHLILGCKKNDQIKEDFQLTKKNLEMFIKNANGVVCFYKLNHLGGGMVV